MICAGSTGPTYSAVKLRDLLSKSQPSHTPEPLSICTSSPSMRKNLCASSTTLASFCSGTPAPPRFNSIRIRRRDIGSLSDGPRWFLRDRHFLLRETQVEPAFERIRIDFHQARAIFDGRRLIGVANG